jgi:excisionase family DNA binding protein
MTQSNSMLLTVAETAEELRVGRNFLYALVCSGVLPSIRMGRRRMIRRSDVLRFIQTGTKASRRELWESARGKK